MVISSLFTPQPPLLIVQRSVTGVPGTSPVRPVVLSVGVVIVAVPLTTLQVPVPLVGVLPAKVAVV